MLLPSPHSLHFSEPRWPGTEQSPGAVGRRWTGQSTKGRGPRPKEGGNLALPPQLPTEFTAQKTPLVQQLPVEVYQGPKGQAGERQAGAVKTTAGSGDGGKNLLLPMGGDDGATDIAVGGHGIQLPPDVMGQTGLVQVVVNYSQFAQSLQTRAKVQNV